jgi:hypothetical protein
VPAGPGGLAGLALARVAVGALSWAAPSATGRAWVGPAGGDPAVRPVVRAFAARDLALGAGTLVAARRGRPVRGWLAAALVSDGADLLAALAGPVRGWRRAGLVVLAGAGVAADLAYLLAPAPAPAPG